MPLTLADKLALIYTSAGSLRRLAAFTGLSRYRVTRLLKPQFLGGYAPDDPVRRNPGLRAIIDTALSIHSDLCRQVARAHRLPALTLPIYMERAPRTKFDPATGERKILIDDRGRPILGERVICPHTHWIDSNLRQQVIASLQQTAFFYQISVRSEIDLAVYFDETEERFKRERIARSPEQWKHRTQFEKKIIDGHSAGFVYTRYASLSQRFSAGQIAADILQQLRIKHEPAAMTLADSFLLQTDTRDEAHKGKARKAKKRTKRR